MSQDPNTSLKSVFIYGDRHDGREGSLIIKPDKDLQVTDGDVFAIMFFKYDRLVDDNIWVTLSSEYPLQDIFDTQDVSSRCPLGLDGRVELKDNSFVTLSVKLKRELLCKEIGITVNVHWANLSDDDAAFYPPEMEIKVKPT